MEFNPLQRKIEAGKRENIQPTVLDGKGKTGLKESMELFMFESGEKVIAGTDAGIGYKNVNEDRVTLVPSSNFAAVIDGMGGHSDGAATAAILAKSLQNSPEDISKAIEQARDNMSEASISDGGAVFISARIMSAETTGKTLDVHQAGDAKLIVISKDGTVSFQSKDQSPVQDFLDSGAITPDQALYHEYRNVVGSAISSSRPVNIKSYYVSVEDGDLVLLMSDGVSDNLTPEEIGDAAKTMNTEEELFTWISEVTNSRMQNREKIVENTLSRETEGKYSDGYKSKPKKDNRALVIMKIK